MSDETRFIAALRAGEHWAIDQLYRDYTRTVLGWVIRLGGARIDAEDVAQDVFIVALRAAPRFRGDARVTTWLFGITRRVLANARRKAALRQFIGLSQIQEPATSAHAEALVARQQQRATIQRALERLRPRQREVLVLVDLEERSAPEVSSMLGIPVGTVYSRLHTGRRAFRTALLREGVDVTDSPSNVISIHRRTP